MTAARATGRCSTSGCTTSRTCSVASTTVASSRRRRSRQRRRSRYGRASCLTASCERDAGHEATARARMKRERGAVRVGDRADDREAEAGTGAGRVAVKALERLGEAAHVLWPDRRGGGFRPPAPRARPGPPRSPPPPVGQPRLPPGGGGAGGRGG